MPVLLLTKNDLLHLVAAASTLDERLSIPSLPEEEATSKTAVNTRLETWCRVAVLGDWERLRARLAWDGLTGATVEHALDTAQLRGDIPLPSWALTLSEALSIAASCGSEAAAGELIGEQDRRFLDPENPLPFEEVLTPFVILATQRCAAQAGVAYHLLSSEAHGRLQRHLLQSLAFYAGPTLYFVFALERIQQQSSLERLLASDHNRAFYQRFVAHMLQGQLARIFQEYAVLARLLATISDRWVEATVEFLQRLAADLPDLQRVFGGAAALGEVSAVEAALSDPHRGRRSVISLTFSSGHRLIYKPKNLGLEEAYQHLLAWCNAQRAPLTFSILRVLNRSSYGWVEYVEHRPCENRAAAQRYFQRAGMLLCLVYVLEGSDCHYDNLIAHGEHPLLVDLETLLQHRPFLDETQESDQALSLAHQQLANSVLHTELLPSWHLHTIGEQQVAFDISGLGGGQPLLVEEPEWEQVNTDHMMLRYKRVQTRTQRKMPLLEGIPLRLDDYADEILTGFEHMYRFLLAHREALLARGGPLSRFADQQVRFVFRATRTYSALLRKLLAPRYLRDGADRSIQLEILVRAVLDFDNPASDNTMPPRWWPIYAAEREALEQEDIPFFTASTRSDSLSLAPGWEIAHCFEQPSFDRVVARLQALSEEDLRSQITFIEGSLCAHVAHAGRHASGSNTVEEAERDANLDAMLLPTTEMLEEQALAIAEQIAEHAIRAPNGSATWIGLQNLPWAGRYQFQPLGYDLYSGTSGVALFLAAMDYVTRGKGSSCYRDLALAATQPLCQALRYRARQMVRVIGIGGASGLGSVVYALVCISRFLDKPSLLEEAQRAALLITEEQIVSDRALDIIAGSAGAILGLLALYDASPSQAILERAIACGQHLLRVRTRSAPGERAWQTTGGRLLTGFSHGAAGIIYALLRLFATTRDAAYREAACEALVYENSLFAPDVGNWPDLRAKEHAGFVTSWCHGAPGIGLARIGGLPMLDTPHVREDIENALQTTLRFGVGGQDHLCCGNLGRGEVLLAAAGKLSRPELIEAARRRAWQVVTRMEQTHSYALNPGLPRRVDIPGFFCGIVGIGYSLLRLANTDRLPCVLLWE
jgi:type 2 lantibiotic biosynthesis protein LanM